MLNVAFLFKALIFLVFVTYIFEVHNVTANTSPRRQHSTSERQAAQERVDKIDNALGKAKLGRSPTARRYYVSAQDRLKYDDHRNNAHKFGAIVNLADLNLSQKLSKEAKPKEVIEHHNQKLRAAQVKVEGKFLQDHHTKAANELLPHHLRDDQISRSRQAAQEHVQNFLRQERLRQSSG